MLYFWINGLETIEEECFTQQQKVFVSVFSRSFNLAGYLVFNSAYPLRVRLRSYTYYRHSHPALYGLMAPGDVTRQACRIEAIETTLPFKKQQVFRIRNKFIPKTICVKGSESVVKKNLHRAGRDDVTTGKPVP